MRFRVIVHNRIKDEVVGEPIRVIPYNNLPDAELVANGVAEVLRSLCSITRFLVVVDELHTGEVHKRIKV